MRARRAYKRSIPNADMKKPEDMKTRNGRVGVTQISDSISRA
jgi:hypothetical protein